MEEQLLHAIMDTDIESMLERTSQFEQFIKGELLCSICGKRLTVDNIGLMRVVTTEYGDKKFVMCCDKATCMSQFQNSGK